MFTGIVEEIGTVKRIRTQQSVRTFDFKQNQFSVQVIKGTENKTYLANIKENDEVNLERAMSGSGRFGGHFVLGHVDAKGTIINIRETPNSRIVSIKASDSVIKQMVKQGSITVDGVSLTIFDLHQHSFDIHLIPETRRSTILSNKKMGDEVHLETDVLFKYVESIVGKNKSDLSVDKLKAYGF